jgi:hypothetical protein
MAYDAASGTVIYRSKMHAGLKRNFQVMSGAAWLELLCRHIPDRYEHLVRYVGWNSLLHNSPLIPLMTHADRGRLPEREKPA